MGREGPYSEHCTRISALTTGPVCTRCVRLLPCWLSVAQKTSKGGGSLWLSVCWLVSLPWLTSCYQSPHLNTATDQRASWNLQDQYVMTHPNANAQPASMHSLRYLAILCLPGNDNANSQPPVSLTAGMKAKLLAAPHSSFAADRANEQAGHLANTHTQRRVIARQGCRRRHMQ
jgi:hypothetical protein